MTPKLVLILSGLSAAVLSATVGLLYFAENRHLVSQLQDEQETALERLASVCRDSLISEDELSRLTYLKTLWNSAEPDLLAYAVLTDGSGRVLMHSDFLKGDMSLKNKREDPPLSPGLVVLSKAVEVRDRRVGTASLAYRRGVLLRAARKRQRGTLLRLVWAAFGGLTLSLLAAVLLARALMGPIEELHSGARKIGGGDLSYRIPASGADELGDLAREFNVMGQRLAELDALKDSFLAQITHDLRNPLATIIGRIDLLLLGMQGKVNAQQLQSLQVAMDSAVYLNELIGDILDITKLEAGKMSFAPRELALKPLAASVADMLKVKAEEYRISVDLSGVGEGVRVRADEQALRRVLVNLLSNAIKFTPAQGRISVRHQKTAAGEDRIAVEDTGIGIPKEKIGTLFKKFSQIPETKGLVRDAPGTGLGLVICRQIVEAHGGRIGVESDFKRGAEFFFTLPPADPRG